MADDEGRDSRAADREDRPRGETKEGDRAGRPCPACGAPMVRRHCEYVCPNHGVVMDCADTFWTR